MNPGSGEVKIQPQKILSFSFLTKFGKKLKELFKTVSIVGGGRIEWSQLESLQLEVERQNLKAQRDTTTPSKPCPTNGPLAHTLKSTFRDITAYKSAYYP